MTKEDFIKNVRSALAQMNEEERVEMLKLINLPLGQPIEPNLTITLPESHWEVLSVE